MPTTKNDFTVFSILMHNIHQAIVLCNSLIENLMVVMRTYLCYVIQNLISIC